MGNKITPEAAFAFLKIVVALSFSRPLPKNASRFRVIRFKTLRFLVCLNVIVLIVPMIYTLYLNDYDLLRMTKLWCLVGPFLKVPLEITLCALQYERLQYLVLEMEYNFENAEMYERDIYQRYTDKCVVFYASSIFAVFLTAIGGSIIGPLTVGDQAFPTDVRYPFDIRYTPVKIFIFAHQFVVVWQCFSIVCLCYFVAFLIWFTAARFEILTQQFRAIRDIIVCIRQHMKLLRYAEEVIIAVRSVLLSIIIICTWTIVGSGLTIISRSTLTEKMPFITMCIAALMEVYACAWPSDYLIDTSSAVARAVYESQWYNQDMIVKKDISFVLLRSQTPIAISISSFLPALSLNYYASYVSTAFSYLMTLRVVFIED